MDVYLHVRVLLSMILGLGVAHLLRGLARIVQHPKKIRIYWVHLVWALFLFLYLIHFWWWEFSLQKVTQWTFPLYFFIAIYATLLYLLCTLLFPDEMDEYDGYRGYFYSRRQWIFSLMAILFIADVLDTFIKGSAYLAKLGLAYDVRTVAYILLSLAAMKIKNPRFHAAFAVFAVVFEVAYILKLYLTIG
jgi:hypothetical protein